MNKRQAAALERGLAKQKGWAATRAANKSRKLELQDEARSDKSTVTASGKPNQLIINYAHTPDPADYERLLVEAGDNKWAFECALDGEDFEVWIEYVPKRFLGRIVVAAWLRGLPARKLRSLLEVCWGKGTPYTIEAAGGQLFNLLRAGEWPLLDELPEQVEIWRGARGCTVEQAGRGLCWSLDRDTACAWLRVLEISWAVRGAPLVIRRIVPRSAIAMVHVPGGLLEVVIEAEPGGDVDGTPNDWAAGMARWVKHNVASGSMFMDDPTPAIHATTRFLNGGMICG